MKRILIGLIAIGIAGTGVFATRVPDLEKTYAAVRYANKGGGLYILVPKDTVCVISDPNQCMYVFPNPANNIPVSWFTLPSIPTNLGIAIPTGPYKRLLN